MNPAIAYLYSLQSFGMKFGLQNIRSLLRGCGDPHRKIPTVHVAGTNGKGSTSSMIAAILTAAGYKVGLYTSPHLVRFNERIRINGVPIPDDALVRYVRALRPEVDRRQATFFEATTAVAFQYFYDRAVDIAVIETGLGGRLDSTNVITPLVSVITSIGKDHTQILGSTYSAIASEKAGIIKRRIPVVIGNIKGTARKVIIKKALGSGSAVIDGMRFPLPKHSTVGLRGAFQQANARTAAAAIAVVSKYFLVGDSAVRTGLEQTAELSGLRARCEYITGSPNLLLDVAHNPDGIRTLTGELKRMSAGKFVLLFGVMKDKDYRSMLASFKPFKPFIVAAQPHGERALQADDLQKECRQLGFRSVPVSDVRNAYRTAMRHAGNKGLVVVTGSHYLLGEVLPLTEKKS
jgi:dihydrofolate synthase/folylpolyglutamate synthase